MLWVTTIWILERPCHLTVFYSEYSTLFQASPIVAQVNLSAEPAVAWRLSLQYHKIFFSVTFVLHILFILGGILLRESIWFYIWLLHSAINS